MSVTELLKNPEIERNLVLSTAHITKEDSEFLEESARDNTGATRLIVYSAEGWFLVYCWHEADAAESVKGIVSDALVECLRIGSELGCTFVKFDRDGPEHEELQSFDW